MLAAKLIRAAQPGFATDVPEPTPTFASKLPGDGDTLRGLPAIGRGVSGAMRGTSPERAIDGLDTRSPDRVTMPSEA